MLLQRDGLFLGQVSPGRVHGLFAVDPGGNEGRKAARDFFALFPHASERIDGASGGPADLSADVPAAETPVFASVPFPDLLDDIFVRLNLIGHVSRIPILPGVIEAEPEFHIVFLRQTAEQVDKVDRGHVGPLFQQVGRRIGDELAVAASDVDHGVDPDGFHVLKIQVPLFFAPVLVGDVVRDLVEEGAGDGEGVPFFHKQFGSERRIGLQERRSVVFLLPAFCIGVHRLDGEGGRGCCRSCESGFFNECSTVGHITMLH